jgi:hypothetical protein
MSKPGSDRSDDCARWKLVGKDKTQLCRIGEAVRMRVSGTVKQLGFHNIGCLEALSLHVDWDTRDARSLLYVLVL